jgi:hypothetical protein
MTQTFFWTRAEPFGEAAPFEMSMVKESRRVIGAGSRG